MFIKKKKLISFKSFVYFILLAIKIYLSLYIYIKLILKHFVFLNNGLVHNFNLN